MRQRASGCHRSRRGIINVEKIKDAVCLGFRLGLELGLRFRYLAIKDVAADAFEVMRIVATALPTPRMQLAARGDQGWMDLRQFSRSALL